MSKANATRLLAAIKSDRYIISKVGYEVSYRHEFKDKDLSIKRLKGRNMEDIDPMQAET